MGKKEQVGEWGKRNRGHCYAKGGKSGRGNDWSFVLPSRRILRIKGTGSLPPRGPLLRALLPSLLFGSPPGGEVTVSVVIESRGEGENLGYITSRSRGQHRQEAGELEARS